MKKVLTILTILFLIGCSNAVSDEISKQEQNVDIEVMQNSNGSIPPPKKDPKGE